MRTREALETGLTASPAGDDSTGSTTNDPPAAPPDASRGTRLALPALVAMALIWGYNWVVMKKALRYVGPFDFSALRTSLAAVVLLLALVALRRPMRVRAWPRVILLGLLQTGLFSALVQLALVDGGAGKTSMLVYTMPFWVVALAWLAFGERIRGLQWLALGLAAAGLVLILEPWRGHGNLASELLALTAGLCWALSAIVIKWIQRDYPMDALPLTAWQMVFGALALCVVAWFVPERPIDPSPYFYGALVYNSVLATGLAWVLWLFALKHLPAGVAGMATMGIPIIGVLCGWAELGERPGPSELAGMAVIALALATLSLRGAGARPRR